LLALLACWLAGFAGFAGLAGLLACYPVPRSQQNTPKSSFLRTLKTGAQKQVFQSSKRWAHLAKTHNFSELEPYGGLYCDLLLAAGCWLLAAGGWLLAAGCWLLAAG
jgi:hypothetical protein